MRVHIAFQLDQVLSMDVPISNCFLINIWFIHFHYILYSTLINIKFSWEPLLLRTTWALKWTLYGVCVYVWHAQYTIYIYNQWTKVLSYLFDFPLTNSPTIYHQLPSLDRVYHSALPPSHPFDRSIVRPSPTGQLEQKKTCTSSPSILTDR